MQRKIYAKCFAILSCMISAAAAAPIGGNGYTLDLSQHGVVCDGITDDAGAINAALASFRSQFKSLYAVTGRITFPAGNCLITQTINLTGLKSKSLTIDGAGSRLVGATNGLPVIDALGSEYLRIRDLTIVGSSDHSPNIGLQIGRAGETSTDSSDNINLDSVAITGRFVLAGLYNLNAETATFTHLIVVNENSDAKSFAVIEDGMNHFAAHSQFIPVVQPIDKPQSFNENIFVNCDIRHNGPGTHVWVPHAARLAFLRSYIAAVRGDTGVILYSATPSDLSVQLEIDAHFETNALNQIFLFAGPNPTPTMRGFKYLDQYPGARKSIFAISSQQRVSIQNLDLDLASTPDGAVLLAAPEKWMLSGRIYLGTNGSWNVPASIFHGQLEIDGKVTFFGQAADALSGGLRK